MVTPDIAKITLFDKNNILKNHKVELSQFIANNNSCQVQVKNDKKGLTV